MKQHKISIPLGFLVMVCTQAQSCMSSTTFPRNIRRVDIDGDNLRTRSLPRRSIPLPDLPSNSSTDDHQPSCSSDSTATEGQVEPISSAQLLVQKNTPYAQPYPHGNYVRFVPGPDDHYANITEGSVHETKIEEAQDHIAYLMESRANHQEMTKLFQGMSHAIKQVQHDIQALKKEKEPRVDNESTQAFKKLSHSLMSQKMNGYGSIKSKNPKRSGSLKTKIMYGRAFGRFQSLESIQGKLQKLQCQHHQLGQEIDHLLNRCIKTINLQSNEDHIRRFYQETITQCALIRRSINEVDCCIKTVTQCLKSHQKRQEKDKEGRESVYDTYADIDEPTHPTSYPTQNGTIEPYATSHPPQIAQATPYASTNIIDEPFNTASTNISSSHYDQTWHSPRVYENISNKRTN